MSKNITTRLRAAALWSSSLVPLALATPALAQNSDATAQNQLSLDENGVDLSTGKFHFSLTEGSVGSGSDELSIGRVWDSRNRFSDNVPGHLQRREDASTETIYLHFGMRSLKFEKTGGVWVDAQGAGGQLTEIVTADTVTYEYVAPSGRVIEYTNPEPGAQLDMTTNGFCHPMSGVKCQLMPTTVRYTNGAEWTLSYDNHTYCYQISDPNDPLLPRSPEEEVQDPETMTWECYQNSRVDKVSNGIYEADFTYLTSATVNGPATGDWYKRASVKFKDLTTATEIATISYTYPDANTTRVTDADGEDWEFKTSAGDLVSIKRPGETTAGKSITYTNDKVTKVIDGDVQTTYAWSTLADGSIKVTKTTGAVTSEQVVVDVVSDPVLEQPVSYTSGSDSVIRELDSKGRVTLETYPEGNKVRYTYDPTHGELTKVERIAKPGSGLPTLVSQKGYIDSCSALPETCRRLAWERDFAGAQVDYSYDTRGNLVKIEGVPSASGGPRPTVHRAFGQHSNSSGSVTKWLLDEERFCTTAANCAGSANERVVEYAYRASDLKLESVTTRSGDGAISATNSYSYSYDGRVASVDGPLAGSGDTVDTVFGFKTVAGSIGVDPDGSGARLRPASFISQEIGGKPVIVRQGATSITGSTNTATLNSSLVDDSTLQNVYDADFDHVVSRKVFAGKHTDGTLIAQTDFSYDSAGRVVCTAVRNNLSSIPA
ncbi:hypothetical protein, partial [Sphingomicrobium arenosum]|uniref:hypothetical protein n=1 Tax=Sphingomicrobium arenosum TaxID=2233861 RepID=UPI002240F0B0